MDGAELEEHMRKEKENKLQKQLSKQKSESANN